MFLNNRYHDPSLGRFISVDPLVSVTRDAYGYGNNNPIAYSDPSGLDSCSWCGSTETGLYGSGQVEKKAALDAAKAACFGGCSNDSYGSAASDTIAYLTPPVKTAELDLKWAGCMVGGSVNSCGVPNYPVDQADGKYKAGSNGEYVVGGKIEQVSHCLSNGTTCRDIEKLAGTAATVGDGWRHDPAILDEKGNAMQHAYGFALFSSRTGYSDGFLRKFGYAHEADGRDNWADTARDLLNNETGIRIGNSVGPSGDLVAAVFNAWHSGQLYCSANGSVMKCTG